MRTEIDKLVAEWKALVEQTDKRALEVARRSKDSPETHIYVQCELARASTLKYAIKSLEEVLESHTVLEDICGDFPHHYGC